MASVNLNALAEVQTVGSNQNMLLFGDNNVATRIDYDKLAEAILNKTRDEIGGVSPISAIAALNSRIPWLKEGMPEKRISAKATIDITTTASTKALVMVLANNIALSALFFVSTTSSGATSIAEVYSGTGLDIAADSFKVSVTNSTSSTAYAYAFIFDGNGMS